MALFHIQDSGLEKKNQTKNETTRLNCSNYCAHGQSRRPEQKIQAMKHAKQFMDLFLFCLLLQSNADETSL